ncbi:MAG: HutD family protein [Flavobacteriaceae bacterium]|nr:HutD family protein [Flavobacteriaceae bacterium]
MNIKAYKTEDYKIGKWSGGTTRELYIYPQNSDYKALNFDVRISSAKVETPSSTFTPLPQVHRQLMILDGSIALTHENRETKELNPFDVATFEGDWVTTSEGICTDFNVMTRGNLQSSLWAKRLNKDEKEQIELTEKGKMFFIYLFNGEIAITIQNKEYQLNRNELLVIEASNFAKLSIQANEKSAIIFVKIS